MKSFSPWYSLVFLVGIGVLSFGLSSIWPEEHPEFLGLEVKFARPNTFNPIHVDTSSQSVNPEQLLAQYQLNSDSANIDAVISAEEQAELDSVALQAKLEAEAKAAFDRLQIKFADDDTTRLAAFFNALAKEGQSANDIDVLHFGDSQIEGDRISGFVRNKWQERWGGTGPGLVPIVEAVPSAAIRQEATDNFQRYALFGKADKPEHDRFGLLASLSVADFSETSIASFTYKPSRLSYWRTKKYTTGRLFFGECADSCIIRYQLGDSLLRVDSFPRIEGQMNRYFQWSSTPEEFTVEIEGKTSPEFYSMNLNSGGGLKFHNIAMRGSSGTIFRKINVDQLKYQLDYFKPRLVLLQYGGNSVPYVEDIEQAERYGNWFSSQIKRLKMLMPNAAFIVIGPSDMAQKVDENYLTYPMLEAVRNALKRAAFENGCGFWDIYEVMGGKNSMHAWVTAEPALAGSDHIHFTNKGAKEVAKLFDQALMEQYKLWEK